MKRAELVVGQEYVVMAPSQRNKGYMFSDYKANDSDLFVTVVDTDPHFTETYRGWRSEDTPATVIIVGPDGDKRTIKADDDRTHDHGEPYNPGYGARSTSLVKVAKRGRKDQVILTVVPLANICMTREEYDAEVAEHTAATKRQVTAQRKAQADRLARIAAIRKLEEGVGADTAGIADYGYGTSVTLSFDRYEALLRRLA